ncbi:hypothetical protein BN14_03592 [Rhizoctonia solani AG-1 IB]|uniref:Uncharacterized protein n=1 Tax=Thanatephorus cucumeris (strain AG1-IB / isolate 7/3/14) TaxID=1108050 RepID=M5BSX1_THACB|nr:hypothetical protein BN14_03592 [Rhizoctonia solani AG-1 IB]
MPIYQSNAKLCFNHCIHIDFYVQNSPEAMKDNLGAAANIIHVLLNVSNRRNIQCIRRNTYKHPRWGFMYWLDLEGKEGTQSFGIARGFSLRLPSSQLCAAVVNFILLYPADSSAVPVSSPVSAHALSDLEESQATPPAGATLLPSLQSSDQFSPNSRPVESTCRCNRQLAIVRLQGMEQGGNPKAQTGF